MYCIRFLIGRYILDQNHLYARALDTKKTQQGAKRTKHSSHYNQNHSKCIIELQPREASKCRTHGLDSILVWYFPKQLRSAWSCFSGSVSSRSPSAIMTSSPSWLESCDVQSFKISSTSFVPSSMTSGANLDSSWPSSMRSGLVSYQNVGCIRLLTCIEIFQFIGFTSRQLQRT